MPDIINRLAGIADDSPLGALRASREVTFNAAAGSYRELIAPADPGGLSTFARDAVAFRIALLEQSPAVRDHHRQRLLEAGATDDQLAGIEQFPTEPSRLDAPLVAALTHADLLTLNPRAATAGEIAALRAAGFSTRDIISLSQLIAFVSYEVRLLSALRVLEEERS
jgi:CMD domain protein